jgi:hypothetical protein
MHFALFCACNQNLSAIYKNNSIDINVIKIATPLSVALSTHSHILKTN